MKCLSRVLHISSSRKLILRSNILVKLGTTIVDNELNEVGNVFDIFGPVNSFYISIKPKSADYQKYVGKLLYLNK